MVSITFLSRKKLLRAKFKKSNDNYYRHTPGATKTIKSKPIPDLDSKDVDDDTTRFLVGTKIFKVFNDVEYKEFFTGYGHKKKDLPHYI